MNVQSGNGTTVSKSFDSVLLRNYSQVQSCFDSF